MARPIPDLDPMEANEVATDDDLLIDDISAGETKRIQVGKLIGLPTVGWTATGESWSFVSWTSATKTAVVSVPSDATTKYSPGMLARITQATGGTKYFIITGVSATQITMKSLSTEVLNDEAITSPMYSTEMSPYGAPSRTVTAEKTNFGGDYSTSEVNTGFTWVDGKDIYKKTINFGALPNNTTKTVAHGISGIDNVIEIKGWTHNPSLEFWYSFNSAMNSAASATSLLGCRAEPSNITVATNFNASDYTIAYITIYYTKT